MKLREKLSLARALGIRRSIKAIKLRLLYKELFSFFEIFGIHVLPVDYSSPLPDTRELRKYFDLWYRESSFEGVDFNLESQLEILHKLNSYESELDELPPYELEAKKILGGAFGPVEAQILYSMIRYFKPRNFIEVGSGVSTLYTAKALSINKKLDDIDSNLFCIEPYPLQGLFNIKGSCKIKIMPKLVQQCSIEYFKILKEGDILFIDSSHMAKIGSDVNYLILEIIPKLNPGVLIHIHDIPFPFPTLNPDLWIFERHQFLTEPALVQAFLMYNSSFKVVLCTSYLHYKTPEILGREFKVYKHHEHFPCSLWLRKIN